MPREQITPSINDAPAQPDGGHYVALPTVQIGWARDLASIQIGLETPDRRDTEGRDALVDHLYLGHAGEIGEHFLDLLRATGRCISDEMYDENNPGHQVDLTIGTIGLMILESVTNIDRGTHGYTGWYTSLDDRRKVNELIRLLKKARDSAFGRDE